MTDWAWDESDHLAVWDATEPPAALRLHLRHEHKVRKGAGLPSMLPEDLRTMHHRIHDEDHRKEPCYHGLCGVSRGLHAALVGDHEFTESP